MSHYEQFIKEVLKTRSHKHSGKVLRDFLKTVKDLSPNDFVEKEFSKDFIAFVTIVKDKFRLVFNANRLKNDQDMLYAYFHEVMHIALKHLILNYTDERLKNFVDDIEVNMYVDRFTYIVPYLHDKLYVKKIRDIYKKKGRKVGFFAYIISRNLILKKYDTLKEFVESELPFLSYEDKKHFIEIENKMIKEKFYITDIIDEMQYWNISIDDVNHFALYINNGTHNVGNNEGKTDEIEIYKRDYMRFLSELKYFLQHSYKLNKTIGKRRIRSVLPLHIGRREVALLSKGIDPIFYNIPKDKYYYGYKKLNMYVDSSGSMSDYLEYVFGLIYYLKDTTKKIFLFDTKIKEVDIGTMRQEIKRGGGTSIDAVLEHILENNIINAVIFTDLRWSLRNISLGEELERRNVSLFIISEHIKCSDRCIRSRIRGMENTIKKIVFIKNIQKGG